jgi:hypothetical protein
VLPCSLVLVVRLGAALALLVAWSARARADESLHASLGLTSGYTDNVFNAAQNPTTPQGAPPIEGDVFALIAPGVRFTHLGPRIVHAASFVWTARVYQENTEGNSYSSMLAYQARITLSPRGSLDLGVQASNGRTNAFELRAPDDPIQAQRNDDVAFVSTRTGATYTLEVSRDWRAANQLMVATFLPIGGLSTTGSSHSVSDVLSATRSFGRHAVTGMLRATYSSVERADGLGLMTERERGVFVGPEVRWLHDLTPSFTTLLGGGLVISAPVDDLGRGAARPTAEASLRYQRQRAQVELGYLHTVQSNLFLGISTEVDTVQLRGGLPFGSRDEINLSGSLGYSRGDLIDLEADAVYGGVELMVADAALSWRLRPELSLRLRYSLLRQVFDQPPFVDQELRVRREAVLTLEGTYPSQEAARVPRASLRADGSDEPIEAERVDGRAQPAR